MSSRMIAITTVMGTSIEIGMSEEERKEAIVKDKKHDLKVEVGNVNAAFNILDGVLEEILKHEWDHTDHDAITELRKKVSVIRQPYDTFFFDALINKL